MRQKKQQTEDCENVRKGGVRLLLDGIEMFCRKSEWNLYLESGCGDACGIKRTTTTVLRSSCFHRLFKEAATATNGL